MDTNELGHLAISRYVGEEIVIGENIVVRVARVRDGKVKLTVIAPKSVRVLRSELITEGKRDDRDGTEAPGGAVRDGASEAAQGGGEVRGKTH